MNGHKSKLNCWEFKKCGREPRGANVQELGVCPVTLEHRLDGTHDGINGGRACWVVAGTFCKGQVQGTFAQKFETCEQCDFYVKVRDEERAGFKYSTSLVAQLRNR